MVPRKVCANIDVAHRRKKKNKPDRNFMTAPLQVLVINGDCSADEHAPSSREIGLRASGVGFGLRRRNVSAVAEHIITRPIPETYKNEHWDAERNRGKGVPGFPDG